MSTVYVDTSVLAKWYLNEAWSDEVAAWIQQAAPVAVSTLTLTEMASLLARRRRLGEIDATLEARIHATLQDDVANGFVLRHPLTDRAVEAAGRLIATLPSHPLRTLDALHLAVARDLGLARLATADRVMAAAAKEMALEVIGFGGT